MPRGNPSPKLAITFDSEIHQSTRADAAREILLRRPGLDAVARWEKQHGRFTPEEMAEARRSVQAQQRRTASKARRPA